MYLVIFQLRSTFGPDDFFSPLRVCKSIFYVAPHDRPNFTTTLRPRIFLRTMEPKFGKTIYAEVGADKRLGRKPAQQDHRIQGFIDQVTEHGYVVIRDAFSSAEIGEAKAELRRLATASDAGPASERGRNTFEGLNTKRIYALINKSRAFDKFALHADVLALNDHFLDTGYLLNAFHSVNIQPGEAPQTLHHDDGYVTVPLPHRPFGTVRAPYLL